MKLEYRVIIAAIIKNSTSLETRIVKKDTPNPYSFFVSFPTFRCGYRSDRPSKHCRNHRLEGVINTTRNRRHKVRYKNTKSIPATKT